MMNLLLSTTFWATLVLTIGLLVARWRRRDSFTLLVRLVSARVVFALLLCGSLVYVGFSTYLGYVAPRDVLQDIVAAQEWQHGRSMHPENLSGLIRESLADDHAAFSLGAWWPRLADVEQEQLQRVLTSHWVQAHPPPMTLLLSPLVAWSGIHGSCIVINLVSLFALLLTLVMIHRGLALPLTRQQALVLAIMVLGWHPIGAVLRNGQSGLVLGLLMTAGWLALRRNQPVLAGLSIGLATSLKLYPGLLLVYLFFRHRRAFVAAAGCLLLITTGTGLIAGWHHFADYFQTARLVSEVYGPNTSNLSLLALLLRLANELSIAPGLARGLFGVLGLTIVVGLVGIIRSRNVEVTRPTWNLDVEFSLCLTLIPLLSPIAWNHYLPIILLPLAVLGQRVLERPRALALKFLGLFLVLAVPEQTWSWLADTAEGSLPSLLILFTTTLPTFALLALSGWLAALAKERPSETRAVIATSRDRVTFVALRNRLAGDLAERHAGSLSGEAVGIGAVSQDEAVGAIDVQIRRGLQQGLG